MRLAVGQINPVIGDVAYNAELMLKFIERAKTEQADLIVFPELALLGYPPKDLLRRQEILLQVEQVLEEVICPASHGLGIILGAPVGSDSSEGCFNSALFYFGGSLVGRQDKKNLVGKIVFDESRYFNRGHVNIPFLFKGIKIGVTIGEDIWNGKEDGGSPDAGIPDACVNSIKGQPAKRKPQGNEPLFYEDVGSVKELVNAGAELVVNLSASPYYYGKRRVRAENLSSMARKYGKTVVFVNQTGGNDELVFDGSSLIVDSRGRMVWHGKAFQEDFAVIDVSNKGLADLQVEEFLSEELEEGIESIRDALVMGIRDYLHKTGFNQAVIGISGGLDSAVTAALAVEALGSENVLGVAMPSMYSSAGSLKDARDLAANLNLELREISITGVFDVFAGLMNGTGSLLEDVAEENLQARIRGNILMFISNREGHLVLTTENKSEMAVGYSTLYGDMSGGLSVLGDVPKTTVYEIAADINRNRIIIPLETISKPPSAELRPEQKDEDFLPPYSVLDPILADYFENNLSLEEMASSGSDLNLIKEVMAKVDRSEYKRIQTPLILRVTDKSYGLGRNFPVAWRRS